MDSAEISDPGLLSNVPDCLLFISVGEPITVPKIDHPSQREIDFYHSMYVSSLIKLFDKYKTKFGLPETEVLDIN